MPGFFALAAEAPTLRATCRHLLVKERSPAPCAHRLGERTERQCRGRVLSLHGAARQSPHCRAWPRSLGLAPCGAGLALHRIETPRAFHGFNQQLGTNRRGSIKGRLFAGAIIEGRIGLSTSARRRTLARSE